MAEFARAWVAGFGSKLVPRVPFEIARLGDSERIVCAHHADAGVLQVMVAPDPTSADRTAVALGRGTGSVGDVYAFVEQDESETFEPAWRIGTREYECAWPRGWTLWSTKLQVDWAFELAPSDQALPRDAMIYLRGPWPNAPRLDDFIADGMREAARRTFAIRGGPCHAIDLEYHHEDVAWWQGRWLAPLDPERVLLVTAQSPREAAVAVRAAGDEIVQGLRTRARS
jgi:hypothetical protein